MTDRLPDATYLRALAKWMMLHGIGSQSDHERLVEIGDGLEWRGIESMPNDGSPFQVLLACDFLWSTIHTARRRNGLLLVGGYSADSAPPVLKWKPLPAPPVGTIGGG